MQDQIQDSAKEKKNEICKAGFNINLLLFLSMLTTVRDFEVRHKEKQTIQSALSSRLFCFV